MQYYPEFTRLVTNRLQQLDRSPTWLATRLNINPGTVSRWLNQNTRPKNPELVIQIADLLGIIDPNNRQALLVSAGFGYMQWIPGENGAHGHAQPLTPVTTNQVAALSPPVAVEADWHGRPEKAPDSSRRALFMAPPPPLHTVFGREPAIGQLTALFALDQPAATISPPVALLGMAGVGKTTLALAFVQSAVVRERFPDGVLWAGLGPKPALRDILNDWGRVLGVDLLHERNEKACQERLRIHLYDQRVLVIIDDVWEIHHAELFQVVGPQGRLLLITRESPIAFRFATRERTLRLDILSAPAAIDLVQHFAPESVASEQDQARQLCERLEYLPLALVLAGQLLATEADVPSRMRRILRELIEQRQSRLQQLQLEERLGLPDDQPASLQTILDMSVQRLNLIDQARFAELSTIARLPFTWDIETVMRLWRCTADEAETTIANFIQRGLAARRGDGYWMHALLVDHAAELFVQRNGIASGAPICA